MFIKFVYRAKKLILVLLSIFSFFQLDAQQAITGTVTDDKNDPLPGVSIQVKNTLRGTFSGVDGEYTITAGQNDTLVFSMVGMALQEIPVGGRTAIDVKLLVQASILDEVVVVGYGSQKLRDLTAPIVTIKGEDLSRQITSNPVQALQGRITGVQVINSGIPGGVSRVRIRGVGSIGDFANPLYVVDGVFVDNIDFLSSGDIEDLTVLKDASSAAIYGVRAANGVILITTKKGTTEKPVINYDGYFGYQLPVNILPMATREQYIELINEANINSPGYVPKVASDYPASTDWYQELVRPASITNHTLDISGSTGKTSYSIGGSYYFQQGIMDIKNDFNRYNFRGRLDQTVNKTVKIGVNSLLSKYGKHIPNDGAFFGAYVNPPLYSIYDENNTGAYPVRFASPQQYGFGNQYGNPVAAAYYSDNLENGIQMVFSTYAEFSLIPDKLVYKVSYNTDLNYYSRRNFTPQFNVGGSQGVLKSSLSKTSGNATKQIIDNLITWSGGSGKNNYSLMAGQSTRIEKTGFLTGSALDVLGFDEQSKYIVTGSFSDRNATDGASAFNGLSLFTRATYNYSGKYLLTMTFRADASSKYQQKWGYFPSVGLGWVISDELFMDKWEKLDFLKVRASWGFLGNDNVPANSALTLGQTGAGSSAIFGDRLVTGVGAQTVVQNYLEWEVVNEFDAGLDFTLFGYSLSGNIDYYYRLTNNVVFFAPIATGGGAAELLGNNGTVLNQGIELNLTWKKNISDFSTFNIGLNVTTIGNKVTKLQGRDYIPGALVRGNFTTRTQVGEPIGSFYGFEIDRVYGSQSEAFLDPQSQAVKGAGFFRYKDQNGDEIIDESDKVFLGSPVPWLIGGIDLGFSYRNLDINLALQGQYGNKILNAKRMNRDVFVDGNYDRDFYENRWSSERISSDYPSAEAYNFSFIQQANDFFVESGAYIRIQNVQIGYNIKDLGFIPTLRIYISAQRPYTFFTYRGFTPEVGGSPISSAIDNSVYPMQSIYTVGAKMSF
jgi:TonB-linked SusC/RagA family outer membrane protein